MNKANKKDHLRGDFTSAFPNYCVNRFYLTISDKQILTKIKFKTRWGQNIPYLLKKIGKLSKKKYLILFVCTNGSVFDALYRFFSDLSVRLRQKNTHCQTLMESSIESDDGISPKDAPAFIFSSFQRFSFVRE